MNITVYSKPDCVQCEFTKTHLGREGLPHTVIDVTADESAMAAMRLAVGEPAGPVQMPVVVVDGMEPWHGFRIDLIRALKAAA